MSPPPARCYVRNRTLSATHCATAHISMHTECHGPRLVDFASADPCKAPSYPPKTPHHRSAPKIAPTCHVPKNFLFVLQQTHTQHCMSNNSLQALTIYPWVYVLRCKPRSGTSYPTLYVGVTLNCHQRVTQHFTGCGARFTQTHQPIAVEALLVDVGDSTETALQREQRITLEYMRQYIQEHGQDAWRSVAGAGYTMPHQMKGRPRDL